MKYKLLIVRAFVCGLLLSWFTGCATDECDQNKNTLPLAGFYSSVEQPKSISLEAVEIKGVGAPGDSILSDANNAISEVYLPFRLDGGETVYCFKYHDSALMGLADTIKFRYDAQPYFVSAACGVSYKFHIKDIQTTHTLIDSISVPNNLIDNTNIQNIRIYFRVDTEH